MNIESNDTAGVENVYLTCEFVQHVGKREKSIRNSLYHLNLILATSLDLQNIDGSLVSWLNLPFSMLKLQTAKEKMIENDENNNRVSFIF